MQIRLKTITPLHIGNGEELHSLDYVTYQNKFYRISQGQFLTFLKPLGKDIATKFSDWVLERAEVIEHLKEEQQQDKKQKQQWDGGKKRDFNQELSALNRGFNYLAFADKIGQKVAFLEYLQKIIVPIPIHANELKQQIRGAIRTADGRAYMPGSTLKGCIRTALLFYMLEESKIPVEKVRSILHKAITKVKENKKDLQSKGKGFNIEKLKANFAEELEQEAFYCKMKTEKGEEKAGEEQYDLLKLLLVSDVYPLKQSLSVENIDSYLVNKTKDKNNSNQTVIKADVQKQPPGLETIERDVLFDCHIEFNIDFLLAVKPAIRNGQILSKGAVHWIGIEEKVQRLFGLDISTINQENKEQKRKEVLDHILLCVKTFSQRQVLHDRNWLKNFHDYDKQRRFGNKLKSGFAILQQNPQATFFNLGYATGFQGTTELLYFIKHCMPEIKSVMELFGIGDKPGAGKNRKPGETYVANPDRFPKSKRLITRQNTILPPGWLVLDDGSSLNTPTIAEEYTPEEAPKHIENPAAPQTALRSGMEIYAQIIRCGAPNQIKLLLGESNQPLIDFRYGPGFATDKKDTWIVVKISALKGKDGVQAVSFVRFVNT